MIMSTIPIPRAWAELGTPGGSKHAASPSVSGGNVSAPLSRHYTVSRLCHQCGTAQPSTSTSAYGTISLLNPNANLLISQPMPLPRQKSSPCMQNSKQDLANNLEIQGRKRPRHCAVHLQFVSVFPSLSLCQLSAHSTLLGAVRSGCEDKCGH